MSTQESIPTDRFRVTDGGCWTWIGNINSEGYGRYNASLAHRYVWERMRGPIDPDVLLHHVCCNRQCVNPDHLEPTTRRDHPDARHNQLAARTHCEYGHPLDGVIRRKSRPGTERYCKTCSRIRARERKEGGRK